MVGTNGFRTDEKLREVFPDKYEEFPCFCKYNIITELLKSPISWHWHKAFEIDYVVKGNVCFQTAGPDVNLGPGEAIFINSNLLHAFKEVLNEDVAGTPSAHGGGINSSKCHAEYYTIFFDPDILSGGFGTLYYDKYVLPILANPGFQDWAIRSDTPAGVRMLNIILDIINLFETEPYGYEFELRSKISSMWLTLLEVTKGERAASGHANMADNARMKQMISFIEDHYPEKISLDDIARAAGIGGRECGRCFDRTVGESPIRYLTRYRIRQAARRIAESPDSIGNIAQECGFSSDSYFGKLFRDAMGTSPGEYRKKKSSL